MTRLDTKLEDTFVTLGNRFSRSGLFKRAAVMAGAVAGYGTVTEIAGAAPCGDQYGACGGMLCCGCYDGCKCQGSQYFCGCRDWPGSPIAYVTTNYWSKCCGSYRYDWWDCGYFKSDGSCAGAGGCPSVSLDCSSCAPNPCNYAYVNCYRCTFRVIVTNGC
jgi:hypothetical protein